MGREFFFTRLLSMLSVFDFAISFTYCLFSQNWKAWILFRRNFTCFPLFVIGTVVNLDRLPMFAIIEIRSAFVKGDRLTLTDFAFKQVVDDLGEHLQLTKPLTGARVKGLEVLSPRTLELWGIRFPSEVDVVFNARTTTANPDATIMTKDAVIAEVGDANEEDLQPSSPEPKKRKMFQCPSCKPSRSFSDERKLIEHMDVCHFFD